MEWRSFACTVSDQMSSGRFMLVKSDSVKQITKISNVAFSISIALGTNNTLETANIF